MAVLSSFTIHGLVGVETRGEGSMVFRKRSKGDCVFQGDLEKFQVISGSLRGVSGTFQGFSKNDTRFQIRFEEFHVILKSPLESSEKSWTVQGI